MLKTDIYIARDIFTTVMVLGGGGGIVICCDVVFSKLVKFCDLHQESWTSRHSDLSRPHWHASSLHRHTSTNLWSTSGARMVKPNNPSRFSSLKVFNFSNQSSKSLHANDNHDHDSCTEAESPPPLPPKDRYYLYNKSMSSLLPDSYSIPSTPLSPTFGKPPLPSQSTIDLSLSEFGGGAGGNKGQRVSPLSSMSGRSTGTSGSGSSRKKGFFGKLAARNNSRNNSKATRVASPECGDEGISAPWNFQVSLFPLLIRLIC